MSYAILRKGQHVPAMHNLVNGGIHVIDGWNRLRNSVPGRSPEDQLHLYMIKLQTSIINERRSRPRKRIVTNSRLCLSLHMLRIYDPISSTKLVGATARRLVR